MNRLVGEVVQAQRSDPLVVESSHLVAAEVEEEDFLLHVPHGEVLVWIGGEDRLFLAVVRECDVPQHHRVLSGNHVADLHANAVLFGIECGVVEAVAALVAVQRSPRGHEGGRPKLTHVPYI